MPYSICWTPCGSSPASRLEEVREIAFEIGMLGQHGLDINDPRETHVLRALPGRTFSSLELLCIMYAGLKRIEPGMDIEVGLGEEWEIAERREQRGFSCSIGCTHLFLLEFLKSPA